MLVLEAKWGGGRCPLNALPKGRAFAFSSPDNAIIEQLETLTNGETPALLQLDAKDFAAAHPAAGGSCRTSRSENPARSRSRKTPLKLPLRATLEANGEIVLSLKDKPAALVMAGDWVWQNNSLQPLGLPAAAERNFSRAGARDARAGAAVPQPALAAIIRQRAAWRRISSWKISRWNRRRRAFCSRSRAVSRN